MNDRQSIGRITAPAKINLCLHITGQREDGYHLLDSLVTPVGIGDGLELVLDPSLTADGIRIEGASIDGAPQDNLVLRAIAACRACLAEDGLSVPPVMAHLEKTLPVASGLGGGSSDAVAAIKLLNRWAAKMEHSINPERATEIALSLGADCPLFLLNGASRMRGIGEDLTDAPGWEAIPVVLVNPGLPVSTPEIFRTLTDKHQPAIEGLPAVDAGVDEKLSWLASSTRNDLQPPAEKTAPVITDVINMLGQTQGCRLARMSGSGATCFGLYADQDAADKASDFIQGQMPDWWIKATQTVSNLSR
ncbi:MAG: 4-(cytidine 5'-diphospho)-2-C-methyl-D-erythritol kinase [Pseudomonadota bacterium]